MDGQIPGAARRGPARPQKSCGGNDMTMTAAVTGTQVYQMYINAPQQRVWEAITTPEIVATYFHGAQVEGSYQPGTRTWPPNRKAASPGKSRPCPAGTPG